MRIGEVEDAEEHAARHRLDAVLAVRERRLQVEEKDHLRERQRDHREVDALAADRERAGDDAEQRAASVPNGIAASGGQPHTFAACAHDVSGGAEEHRVAERQQSAEADQQIERAGEEREAQRLHQEHRIDADERRDGEHHRHQRRRDQHAVPAGAPAAVDAVAGTAVGSATSALLAEEAGRLAPTAPSP